MADFKYAEITEKLIGAAFRVHGTLGFQELIYQRAMELGFHSHNILHVREFEMPINYLEAYNLEIGLLINFGSKRLEFHRFTNKKYNPQIVQHPTIPIHHINPSSDR